MRRALTERDLHRPQVEEYVDADTAFHRSIVIAAHNPLRAELFNSLTPRSRAHLLALKEAMS